MTRSSYIPSLFLFAVMLTGCQKRAIDFDFDVLQLPVEEAVRGLYADGDSLVVVGGAFNGRGFIVSGALSTETFTLEMQGLKHELYAVGRYGDRWYVSGDSLLVHRGSSLSEMRELYWQREDWVSDLSKHPIRAIEADSIGILMVGGGKLAFGVLYHSYDGGASWNPIEPENEFRCAELRDGYAWAGGNGILMRSLWGTGEWERLRLEDQFITALRFFNSLEGLALTEKGRMLETDDGGTSWTQVHREHAPSMRAMASDGEAVVCVGDQGTVLYRASAVADWKVHKVEGFRELYDAVLLDGRCYIAADKGRVITFPLEALK